MFYCTAKRSPRCVGSWGRADLPAVAGGPCHPCRAAAADSQSPEEELVGVLVRHLMLGGIDGAGELAALAEGESPPS